MILTLQQVSAEIEVSDADLRVWIEQRWVLPTKQDETFLFDAADLARVRLIRELRNDLMVNEEGVPVVLSLLDQIHTLRRALARLNAAIDSTSPETRTEIARRLGGGD
ncbi:MAG: chaperone modulator CbpM [Dongiaceae bacterium]